LTDVKEEIKAGIIIGVSFLILTALVIVIGGSNLFEKFDVYYVRVMNTAGLEVGAQVKLGGVRVGRVLSVREPKGPGEPVVMEIGLKQGTPVYKGTRALITQLGFVGDLYLLLAIDQTSGEKIKVGSVIPSEESIEFALLMKRAEGLMRSVDGLIKDVDKVFSQKNLDGVEHLIGNLNKAVVSTDSNIGQVSAGLKTATKKLEIVLDEVEGLLKDNRGEVAQLIKKAREDLNKAGDMISSIEKTSNSLDSAINLQSENLDTLLKALTETTGELQEVLQQINAKPWSFLYQERKEE
jgi:phospholipid/cholesterol/gamma-HCH transport system substrate-binding protein